MRRCNLADTTLLSQEASEMYFTEFKQHLIAYYGVYVCLTLQALGVSCVNEETLPEIKTREMIFTAITSGKKEGTKIKWKKFLGLQARVVFEPRSKFISRISKHEDKLTKRDISRICKKHYDKINEAKRNEA
tara:strand:+ start:108 stop:503 length:396 start_codon:yes stop_codon:yes gene_type:complete